MKFFLEGEDEGEEGLVEERDVWRIVPSRFVSWKILLLFLVCTKNFMRAFIAIENYC